MILGQLVEHGPRAPERFVARAAARQCGKEGFGQRVGRQAAREQRERVDQRRGARQLERGAVVRDRTQYPAGIVGGGAQLAAVALARAHPGAARQLHNDIGARGARAQRGVASELAHQVAVVGRAEALELTTRTCACQLDIRGVRAGQIVASARSNEIARAAMIQEHTLVGFDKPTPAQHAAADLEQIDPGDSGEQQRIDRLARCCEHRREPTTALVQLAPPALVQRLKADGQFASEQQPALEQADRDAHIQKRPGGCRGDLFGGLGRATKLRGRLRQRRALSARS